MFETWPQLKEMKYCFKNENLQSFDMIFNQGQFLSFSVYDY